ncbi:hypothetical protein FDP41_011716 [Naegleria fowleri]|uniref:HD domain-containing protein n=1 Tax=Naegleria fowleri TaxID=5763 RepID=A0A6A5C8Z5_NAEFO|nr:uncharacterized protein FDP41_011716 [Naegleria fowleri]KAF0981855.1 hypothetical protein FDP41_011716 [Naegleria fowleri]CAG4709842.1 unnamed protein product [Naegleria fowleri]
MFFPPSSSLSSTSQSSESPNFMTSMVEREWFDLCSQIGIREFSTISKWWKHIREEYDQPNSRFYHTTTHLFHLLSQCRDFFEKDARFGGSKQLSMTDFIIIRLAIFFHDIIYDAKRKDNEEASARVFMKFVNETRPEMLRNEDVQRIVMFIECTANHLSHKDKKDQLLFTFLDFDLAVLAMNTPKQEIHFFKDILVEWKNKEEFLDSSFMKHYVENVRKEYGHLSDQEFAKGRSAFLRKMLDNPDQLFYTTEAKEKLEKQALMNLKMELSLYEQEPTIDTSTNSE